MCLALHCKQGPLSLPFYPAFRFLRLLLLWPGPTVSSVGMIAGQDAYSEEQNMSCCWPQSNLLQSSGLTRSSLQLLSIASVISRQRHVLDCAVCHSTSSSWRRTVVKHELHGAMARFGPGRLLDSISLSKKRLQCPHVNHVGPELGQNFRARALKLQQSLEE